MILVSMLCFYGSPRKNRRSKLGFLVGIGKGFEIGFGTDYRDTQRVVARNGKSFIFC